MTENKPIRSEEYELQKQAEGSRKTLLVLLMLLLMLALSYAFFLAYFRNQYETAGKAIELVTATTFTILSSIIAFYGGKEMGKMEAKNNIK